jgi:hypothetical protein
MSQRTYEIRIVMTTPYNPDKWDWDELVASEPDERIISVSVNDAEVDECETCGNTGKWETTLEDSPTELVNLGSCPDCQQKGD